ncbi:MAG: hypothetical protein ACPGSO_04055 [Vicingaceae bacterium]
MKKIGLAIVGLLFVMNSFSQMGMMEKMVEKMGRKMIEKARFAGENLEDVKELKGNKLYVYLTEKSKKKDIKAYNLFVKNLKENWSFSDIQFIDKVEFSALKKDKSLFFLTNKLKAKEKIGGQGGMPMTTLDLGNYLTLTKGQPLLRFNKVKDFIYKGMWLDAEFKRKATSFVKKNLEESIEESVNLMDNYLHDCIRHQSTDPYKISQLNAPILKGKTLVFVKGLVDFFEKDVEGITEVKCVFIEEYQMGSYINNKEENYILEYTGAHYMIKTLDSRICFFTDIQSIFNPVLTLDQFKVLAESIGQ